MIRKDYIRIAEKLHDMYHFQIRDKGEETKYGFALAVDSVVNALKSDNPRFDGDKFVEAITK